MKGGKEHRVPLSPRAAELLEELSAHRLGDLVFPGQNDGRPLSNMAMNMLLRRLKAPVTVHGFRSAFRDWCGEETDFPREVAEQALAHTVGNEVERAYRRGDALAKRKELMEAQTSQVGDRMAQGEHGRIIVLMSAMGVLPMLRHPVFSMQSAALLAGTRALAMRLGPKLLVNAIGTGLIGDPPVSGVSPDLR